MSQTLCTNCGHPLPNATGSGLYCTECGEPVFRPKAQAEGMAAVRRQERQDARVRADAEAMGQPAIHKAAPAAEFAEDAASVCVHCHREIKRVPGGQGTTWVHADTGAVVGPDHVR